MPAISPLLPLPVLCLIFGAAFLLMLSSYRRLEKGREAVPRLLLLRFFTLAVLFIVALRPRMEFTEERIQKDRIYFIADASESMTIKDMPGNKTRSQHVRKMFKIYDDELDKLKQKYDVKLFTFARDLNKNEIHKGSKKSTAMGTALYKTAVDSKIRKVKAAVLLSDGLNNSGTSINRAVSELKRRNIPVYTTVIGQNSYQGNIVDGVIQEVDCPQTIKKDRVMPVTVRGIIRGMQGKKVKVEVLIDDKPVKDIEIEISQEEQNFFKRIDMEVKDFEAGYRKITARVTTGPKEISPANNSLNNYFQIKEGGLKLLLLATAPSPDFKFLNRLINSFDDISPTIPNPFLCRTPEGQQFLKELDIKEYDLIIMQNPNISLLPTELLQKCDAQMKTRKQGFLITGESLVRSLVEINLLKEYLPFIESKPLFTKVESTPELTNAGKSHFITGFINELKPLDKAESFPPIDGRVSNLKPALTAKVLIKDSTFPLLVADTYKRCRVAWLNTSGLWQWMTSASSRGTYKTLWRRMIYHLAHREDDLSASLAIYSGKTRFMSTDRITVKADLLNDKGIPVTGARITLKADVQEEESKKTTFLTDGDEYKTGISFHKEGLYTLKAETEYDGKKLESNEIKIFIQEPRVEFERILADSELMSKIAAVTGGRQIDHPAFNDLLRELQTGSQVRSVKTVKSTKDAWDNLFTYLAAALLLSIEWFKRRRIGLS